MHASLISTCFSSSNQPWITMTPPFQVMHMSLLLQRVSKALATSSSILLPGKDYTPPFHSIFIWCNNCLTLETVLWRIIDLVRRSRKVFSTGRDSWRHEVPSSCRFSKDVLLGYAPQHMGTLTKLPWKHRLLSYDSEEEALIQKHNC